MAAIDFSVPDMNTMMNLYKMGMMGTLKSITTQSERDTIRLFSSDSKIILLPSAPSFDWLDIYKMTTKQIKTAFYVPPSILNTED